MSIMSVMSCIGIGLNKLLSLFFFNCMSWFRFCGTCKAMNKKYIYFYRSLSLLVKLMSHCHYLQYMPISSMKFIFDTCMIYEILPYDCYTNMYVGQATNEMIIWTKIEHFTFSLTIFSHISLLRIVSWFIHIFF